jgi:hypothetical protein
MANRVVLRNVYVDPDASRFNILRQHRRRRKNQGKEFPTLL